MCLSLGSFHRPQKRHVLSTRCLQGRPPRFCQVVPIPPGLVSSVTPGAWPGCYIGGRDGGRESLSGPQTHTSKFTSAQHDRPACPVLGYRGDRHSTASTGEDTPAPPTPHLPHRPPGQMSCSHLPGDPLPLLFQLTPTQGGKSHPEHNRHPAKSPSLLSSATSACR